MGTFEYRFVKASTGRVNKGVATAYDEMTLLADLKKKGMEAFDVVRLPERSATEAQIDYLRDLGVAPPSGLTLAEASDLITNANQRKVPAGSPERRLAQRYKVEITRFSSKETIYRLIVNHLLGSDDVAHLAEWFAFRVYRSRCDRNAATVLNSPDDSRFALVGRSIEADQQARRSLLAAARSTNHGFRWFGEYRGWQGNSDRSIAFKVALSGLTKLRATTNRSAESGKSSSAPTNKQRWLC